MTPVRCLFVTISQVRHALQLRTVRDAVRLLRELKRRAELLARALPAPRPPLGVPPNAQTLALLQHAFHLQRPERIEALLEGCLDDPRRRFVLGRERYEADVKAVTSAKLSELERAEQAHEDGSAAHAFLEQAATERLRAEQVLPDVPLNGASIALVEALAWELQKLGYAVGQIKILVRAMATHKPAHIKEAFVLFAAGTGSIHRAELVRTLAPLRKILGPNPSDAFSRELAHVAVELKPDLRAQNSLHVYDHYDQDGSGGLDKHELKAALNQVGKYATDDLVEKIMQRFDLDQSGTIDQTEFQSVLADWDNWLAYHEFARLLRSVELGNERFEESRAEEATESEIREERQLQRRVPKRFKRAYDRMRKSVVSAGYKPEQAAAVLRAMFVTQEPEALQPAWAVFDPMGRGHLTLREVQSIFAIFGESIDASSVKAEFVKLDTDQNGVLEFEELGGLLRRLAQLARGAPRRGIDMERGVLGAVRLEAQLWRALDQETLAAMPFASHAFARRLLGGMQPLGFAPDQVAVVLRAIFCPDEAVAAEASRQAWLLLGGTDWTSARPLSEAELLEVQCAYEKRLDLRRRELDELKRKQAQADAEDARKHPSREQQARGDWLECAQARLSPLRALSPSRGLSPSHQGLSPVTPTPQKLRDLRRTVFGNQPGTPKKASGWHRLRTRRRGGLLMQMLSSTGQQAALRRHQQPPMLRYGMAPRKQPEFNEWDSISLSEFEKLVALFGDYGSDSDLRRCAPELTRLFASLDAPKRGLDGATAEEKMVKDKVVTVGKVAGKFAALRGALKATKNLSLNKNVHAVLGAVEELSEGFATEVKSCGGAAANASAGAANASAGAVTNASSSAVTSAQPSEKHAVFASKLTVRTPDEESPTPDASFHDEEDQPRQQRVHAISFADFMRKLRPLAADERDEDAELLGLRQHSIVTLAPKPVKEDAGRIPIWLKALVGQDGDGATALDGAGAKAGGPSNEARARRSLLEEQVRGSLFKAEGRESRDEVLESRSSPQAAGGGLLHAFGLQTAIDDNDVDVLATLDDEAQSLVPLAHFDNMLSTLSNLKTAGFGREESNVLVKLLYSSADPLHGPEYREAAWHLLRQKRVHLRAAADRLAGQVGEFRAEAQRFHLRGSEVLRNGASAHRAHLTALEVDSGLQEDEFQFLVRLLGEHLTEGQVTAINAAFDFDNPLAPRVVPFDDMEKLMRFMAPRQSVAERKLGSIKANLNKAQKLQAHFSLLAAAESSAIGSMVRSGVELSKTIGSWLTNLGAAAMGQIDASKKLDVKQLELDFAAKDNWKAGSR
jgi:Ca2+-binding EF-hand superfamily protein